MATRNQQYQLLREQHQRRHASMAGTATDIEGSATARGCSGNDDEAHDGGADCGRGGDVRSGGYGAAGSGNAGQDHDCNDDEDKEDADGDRSDDDDDDDDDDISSSLADTVAWHQDDLIVAAELGKALLERNRRLKSRLRRARAACQERGREAAQLASRLADMRRLEDSRVRACDEVERHCAELEARNDQLRSEQRRCRLHVETLAAAEAAAEGRADDLRRQLATATAALAHASASATPAAPASAIDVAMSTVAAMATSKSTATRQRPVRRGSWPSSPTLASSLSSSPASDAPTATATLSSTPMPTCLHQSRMAAAGGGRAAAPSEPPPVHRRRLDGDDDTGRAERALLASGQHQPAYRLLFAEARARLRELMQQQPEADEGEPEVG